MTVETLLNYFEYFPSQITYKDVTYSKDGLIIPEETLECLNKYREYKVLAWYYSHNNDTLDIVIKI